jgi:disulfide bond formation protein DsbB
MNVQTANHFFAFLSFAALAGAVAIPIAAIIARRSPDGAVAQALDDLRPVALWLAFAVAAVATVGSLYYSEIANYTPCRLCWYQRAAMYPLAPILGIAALLRDARAKYLAIPVAAIGAAIATYHYQLEMFPEQSTGVCSVDVPCTVRWFEVFGFVSLAFMALTGFLAIIALTSIARPRPTEDSPQP